MKILQVILTYYAVTFIMKIGRNSNAYFFVALQT